MLVPEVVRKSPNQERGRGCGRLLATAKIVTLFLARHDYRVSMTLSEHQCRFCHPMKIKLRIRRGSRKSQWRRERVEIWMVFGVSTA